MYRIKTHVFIYEIWSIEKQCESSKQNFNKADKIIK